MGGCCPLFIDSVRSQWPGESHVCHTIAGARVRAGLLNLNADTACGGTDIVFVCRVPVQSVAMAWVFHRLYGVVRTPRFRDARLFMLIFLPSGICLSGCFSSQFHVPAAVCPREKHSGEESWGKINLTALAGSASMGT